MPHEMPKPGPEHEELAALEGTWEGEEQLSPSPWGPGGKARGRMTMKRDLEGFFVLQDYVEEKDGRVVYRGHGVLGFDPGAKAYTWYWVDSMGAPSQPTHGQWKGDTLVFTQTSARGDSRYTYRFETARRLEFRIESRSPGQDWQTFMTGTYDRR